MLLLVIEHVFVYSQRRAQTANQTATIDHVLTGGTLEAAVLEVRLIHAHLPRYNRQARTWGRYAYLELTLGERSPSSRWCRQPETTGRSTSGRCRPRAPLGGWPRQSRPSFPCAAARCARPARHDPPPATPPSSVRRLPVP